MTRIIGFRVLAFILTSTIFVLNPCRAQSGSVASRQINGGWSVIERGMDYKVLQTTNVVNGTNCVHTVKVIASGLSYTNSSGRLTDSIEQITVQPDGSATATQGRHSVKFPADIYNGVLQVTTPAPSSRNLFSRPLCVCYDDGSNTVVIAILTNSVGCLTASNQVTYPNCFSGINADIVATYHRGGFECDLVFRSQPPPPGQWNLDPSFCTLQLVTEFFNTEDPQQIPAGNDDWFGLQDTTLNFGRLTMTHGKAFAFKPATPQSGGGLVAPKSDDEGGSTPVYKSWVHTDDGRKFLVEQVPLSNIADQLNALPLTALGSTGDSPVPVGDPPTGTAGTTRLQPYLTPSHLAIVGRVPSRGASPQHLASLLLSTCGAVQHPSPSISNPISRITVHGPAAPKHCVGGSRFNIFPPSHGILLASDDIKQDSALPHRLVTPKPGAGGSVAKAGFVLDYQEIVGDYGDYTFGPGTWFVEGPVYCNNAVIQSGAIFKYPYSYTYSGEMPPAFDAYIEIDGSITCPAATNPPAYFTAADDDSLGDSMNGIWSGYTGVIQDTSGSGGNFAGYGAPALSFPMNPNYAEYGPYSFNLTNIRIRHAQVGIFVGYDNFVTLSDAEVTGNCLLAAYSDSGMGGGNNVQLTCNNCLVSSNANLVFDSTSGQNYCYLNNCTIDNCPTFLASGTAAFNAINCIFSYSGNPGYADYNGFYNTSPCGTHQFTSSSFPFTTATDGTANYYLTANSPFHQVGTVAGMDPNLLADLQAKTTYAPQDGGTVDTPGTDLGYHYSISENSEFGSLPDSWLYYWFGNYNHSATDVDEKGNTLLSDYKNYAEGIITNDPNIIQFSINVTNNYVIIGSTTLSLDITFGTPNYYAVLIDSTNFATADWPLFSSTNITIPLGSTQGRHQVWIGLRGPAPNSTQTWQCKHFTTTLPPILVITNLLNGFVDEPLVQIYGYSQEPLATISCDISNASAVVTGLPSEVTDQYLDAKVGNFTTNYFECLDVPLTNGVNIVTLHATDLAGGVTTTNFIFTLDYSHKTNPPAMLIQWPQDGTQISGNTFTCRGVISDPTAAVTTQVVFTNSDTNLFWGGCYTNVYIASVERNGSFWLENLPLLPGLNTFTITATDVVGNTFSTNISIVESALILTINPVTPDSQLWQPTVNLTGTISDSSCAVWVNGVKGHNNGNGTWQANNVPVNDGGTASFTATAYSPTEKQPDGSYGN